MLKNPKLIEGHYECRRLDETLPFLSIFSDGSHSARLALRS
jgi:hypothetical protein